MTNKKEYRKALGEALKEDDNAVLRILKSLSVSTAEELGIQTKPDPEGRGVVVSSVKPGSKAEEAGIKLETIICEIDGKSTKTMDDYDRVLNEALATPGEVRFDVARRIVASKLSKVGIIEVQDHDNAVIVKKMKPAGSEDDPAGMEGIKEGNIITHVIDEMKITDIDSYKKAVEKAFDDSDKADRVIIKRGELGGIKLASIDALGQIGDVKAIEPLLRSLESEDRWVRRAAAGALEGMNDERLVQPFMRHLLVENESDLEVRRSSARALARMQPVEAIEVLAQALKDPSLGVRLDAGHAPGRIGEPAIEALVKARNDEDSKVRDSAVAALGNIGGSQVRDELIDVLRDKNEESTVKLTAIQALNKIRVAGEGDTKSGDELRKVKDESEEPGLRAFVEELLTE